MFDTLRVALMVDEYATSSRRFGYRSVGFPRARKVRALEDVERSLFRMMRRLDRAWRKTFEAR